MTSILKKNLSSTYLTNMRLLLIRHGETSANAEGRLQGHLDVSLSEPGRGQSEQLAERLSHLSLEALYTSPLKRARETAHIIAGRNGLTPEDRPALMERDVGELAGLNREEIRARYPDFIRARAEARPDVAVPGFESDADLKRRVLGGLGAIIESHPGETIGVVSHGGVIAAFLRETLQMPTTRPGAFAVSNASITTFDLREGERSDGIRPRVVLVSLNDICHLDGL
ncbi:MAG: histidine phosphatase family protein [Chloroflexi bacterium]|nr:histidine phosphatase family protein [Chloroflexota bacterium]